MSQQNENQPNMFEKVSAVTEIISWLAAGGGSVPTSQVIAETQECKPGYELQIPNKYEQLPKIAKLMSEEEQLEELYEQTQEQKKEEMEREIELSNQPSISGGSPPNPESEDANSETVNEIISLIGSSVVAETETEPETETETISETETEPETETGSMEESSESESESE